MDYADLVKQLGIFEKSPESLLSLFFLTLGRIAPIISLVPFFGARVLTHPVKAGLSFSFVIVVMPKVAHSISGPLEFNGLLMFLLIKELFIGFILAFFIGLPFLIVSSSGLLIDHQRGAASLMMNDPTLQNQSSPIGTLYNMVLIVLFYLTDAPFHVLDTIFSSFDLVAPDSFLSSLLFIPQTPLHVRITTTLQSFAEMSVQFAMPAMLTILMTDTFLGIINRLAPNIHITFLGMGFKSWLAILIVCVGWSPMVQFMSQQITKWMFEFSHLIQEVAIGQLA